MTEEQAGEVGEPAVGSPEWLERQHQLERAKERGTAREVNPRTELVCGIVVLVGFGIVNVVLLRDRRDPLFELTPYGVLLIQVFPMVLGAFLVWDGVRRGRS